MEHLPALPDKGIHALLSQALDKQVPVEVIERLLAVREKLKAEAAAEAFVRDMIAFQAECPVIPKNKVRYNNGQPVGRYATVDTIVRIIKPLAAQKGFTYRINVHYVDREVHVECIVSHREGHVERTLVPIPEIERTKLMNDAQVRTGTITMAKREAICNAFGVVPEEDTEGIKPRAVFIQEAQLVELEDLIQEKGVAIEEILEKAKVNSLADLSYEYATKLITFLKG